MTIDERIAAYLDGSMSDEDVAVFEAELEQDPSLATTVERMAGNDDLLRSAFDAPMHEPVDAALIARMRLGAPSSAAPGVAANDNPPFLRRWRWPIGGAIAASLALVMVLQSGGKPDPADAFSIAMETTPSSSTVPVGTDGTITPRLTFAARDGRYCREFDRQSTGSAETGIACRADGRWTIEATAPGSNALVPSGEIATASGADTAPLDRAYERLGASDPVDAQTEQALIAGKWAKR